MSSSRWSSTCGKMSLLLLEEEEPGWEHWCVVTPGVGNLSLDAPGASPPNDPREKVIEIARTIEAAVEGSSKGSRRTWRPSAGFELGLRMQADPEHPGASSQVMITHPSALSRCDIQIWPEGARGSIAGGDDLKGIVPSEPCRAMMRKAGEVSKVLALNHPSTLIMLPRLDAVSMLRLVAEAMRRDAAT